MKALAATILLLFSSSPVLPQSSTWDGFVTDTHCGTHCQRTSAMTPDKACIRRCVAQGSKYGLWFKDQVVVLEPQARAARFAGENVRVTGELSEGIIHIKSIAVTPQH